MITAVDTNVIVGLWDAKDSLHLPALKALESAFAHGGVVICGAVFGELLACPGRTVRFIDDFLTDTEITVDWASNEDVWRAAGVAFKKYAASRRRQKAVGPRRILTDFYIGAHAASNRFRLLTLDDRIYKSAFPHLDIVRA
jgi:hypothetical protein